MILGKISDLINTIYDSNYENVYRIDIGMLACFMLHPILINHLKVIRGLYNECHDNDTLKEYTDDFNDLKYSIATDLNDKGIISSLDYYFLNTFSFRINQLYNLGLGTYLLDDADSVVLT